MKERCVSLRPEQEIRAPRKQVQEEKDKDSQVEKKRARESTYLAGTGKRRKRPYYIGRDAQTVEAGYRLYAAGDMSHGGLEPNRGQTAHKGVE